MASPSLYGTASKEAWIKEFTTAKEPTELCDGQFVTGPGFVLCFAQVQGMPPLEEGGRQGALMQSFFPGRTAFIWQAARNYEPDWLPASVCDAQFRHKGIPLFIRTEESGPYTWVGFLRQSFHSVTYGMFRTVRYCRFQLMPRLPDPLWASLAGPPGFVFYSDAFFPFPDQSFIPRYFETLPSLYLERSSGDGLVAFVNKQRAMLKYWTIFGEGQHPWTVRAYDPSPPAKPKRSVFSFDNGEQFDEDIKGTVPRNDGLKAIEQFLLTGELTGGFDWR